MVKLALVIFVIIVELVVPLARPFVSASFGSIGFKSFTFT